MVPNVMQGWVSEITAWNIEYILAIQKLLSLTSFWELSL